VKRDVRRAAYNSEKARSKSGTIGGSETRSEHERQLAGGSFVYGFQVTLAMKSGQNVGGDVILDCRGKVGDITALY
jgi:hypothetical protein